MDAAGGLGGGDAKEAALNMASSSAESFFRGEEGEGVFRNAGQMMEHFITPNPFSYSRSALYQVPVALAAETRKKRPVVCFSFVKRLFEPPERPRLY